MHSEFIPLLLVTVLAVTVPVLASRLQRIRLPIVVGEIIAGMIIGKSGLNIVEPNPILTFLAEIGFAFLMFLSGLEINFDSLTNIAGQKSASRWKAPIPLAVISFAGTVTLALFIGFGLTQFELARNPILMGLILSTTSLGVVVPILKERGLIGSQYGQVILIAALISDFVTLLLLSAVIAVISQGLTMNLLLFMVLLLAFAAAAKLLQWVNRLTFIQRLVAELSHATAQIKVRGAFALMVLWVVLAESLGVEIILGAFLAGALLSISNRGEKEDLQNKLDAIGYGFLIPIFFINVGVNFDLPALLSSPAALALLPLLLVAAYLVKFIPTLLFKLILSWRETLGAGALLSSRLSLIIAASAIAFDLDMITSATNSAVILIAIVTCTLSPLLFSRIVPPEKIKKREGIIILGTDQIAILLGQRLKQGTEPIAFIGLDQENIAYLSGAGFQSTPGNPAEDRVLEAAGLSSARALLSVTARKELAYEVCRKAVDQYGVPLVIARLDDPVLGQQLQAAGIKVVQSSLAVVLALEVALEFPTAFSMLIDKKDGVEIRDIEFKNNALAGTRLRQIRLPGNTLVIGIQRKGEIIIPHGDTVLTDNDQLLLVGNAECLLESAAILNGSK